jgi:hypothetical protein
MNTNWPTRTIAWQRSEENPDILYTANVDGQHLAIYLGDFPAEDLYTLLVEDVPVEALNDWPAAWVRPTSEQSSSSE